MGIRPQSARWFELLTPRDQLPRALECLASTGAVELCAHSEPESHTELPGLAASLDEYGELARRFAPWWPPARLPALDDERSPAAILADALDRLREWAREADPVVRDLETMDGDAAGLRALSRALEGSAGDLPDLAALAAAGPVLAARLWQLPRGLVLRSMPPSVITQWLGAEESLHLLAVGPAEQMASLERQVLAGHGRPVPLPQWLPRAPAAARQAIAEREDAIATRRAERLAELDALAGRLDVAGALGDMALVEWFGGHAPTLPVTEHFAWVTGWTSDPDGGLISAAMEQGRVRHLLRLKPPPPGLECPVVLRNPAWARPFELFARLLGTPGPADADPSRLVALMAPLLFGFMFGDVGQGAVLLAGGLLLRRRWPMLAILVPGGMAAMAFGLAFGSVFGREDLIPALWLHPLAEPLPVLGATLGIGVAVIVLGLALDALQAAWRHQGLRWLATRAGLVVAYAGLVASFGRREALWLLPVGALWFTTGTALYHRPRGAALPAALGELVETLLQLAVNTVSFVRVGAFALAHAGLCAAVVGMAEAAGGGWKGLPVLVLGNVLIIGLEGLVVGIQTTRLVLFEFFIRFLTAEGRALKPLAGPTALVRTSRRTPT